MADVLVASSPSTMTILHPQDPYQSMPPQTIGTSRVIARGTHSSGYYGPPISQYSLQNLPVLRPDPRAQLQRHSFGQAMQVAHPDSSSSTTSTTSSSSNRSSRYAVSKDDSIVGMKQRPGYRDTRVASNTAASLSTPDLSLTVSPQQRVEPAKPSPDRYHRMSKRLDSSTIVLPEPSKQRPVSTAFSQAIQPENAQVLPRPQALRQSSYDDSVLASSRYKRRSFVGRPDSFVATNPVTSPINANATAPTWSQVVAGRHNMQGPLPPPQVLNRNLATLRPQSMNDLRLSSQQPAFNRHSTYGPPYSQVVDGRPRTAPMAISRPMTSPPAAPVKTGPLTRPSTASPAVNIAKPQPAATKPLVKPVPTVQPSPAVQKLSALNEKASKAVKSRLRRAFSFASSQEIEKATAENNEAAERAKLRKERFGHDEEDVDATLAAEQEANGLGNQIYSGQGQFAVSTDNISISSTASSASIMLRKVGRGMKRSTRNLRNMFRPKSVIGSPSADSVMGNTSDVDASVEAERERVNVNLHPHDRAGGGTGYPRLERNSMELDPDVVRDAVAGAEMSRRSIIGGDRERAEVLGAIRKGILKRAGTSSNSSSPSITHAELGLPGNSSAPATPVQRYSSESSRPSFFEPPPTLRHAAGPTGSTRSLPTAALRNISFNTKVSFHDMWSPSEYDRRGEIATCNRLTPMLAQQIKEELNSFKMEMEVHEDSKPHTHFF